MKEYCWLTGHIEREKSERQRCVFDRVGFLTDSSGKSCTFFYKNIEGESLSLAASSLYRPQEEKNYSVSFLPETRDYSLIASV